MNRETIEKAYQVLHKAASKKIRRSEPIYSVLVPFDADGDRFAAAFSVNDYPKPMWYKVQQMLVHLCGPHAFIAHVSEAWVSKATTKNTKVMPKDDPNHEEAVIFNFLGEGWQAFAFCVIDRKTKTLAKNKLQFPGQDGFGAEGMMVAPQPAKH